MIQEKERQLTFTFHYEEPNHTLPVAIEIIPDPFELGDYTLLMVIAAFSQVLSNRHGLEQALKLIEDAGYSKIDDCNLYMKWTKKNNMDFYEDW